MIRFGTDGIRGRAGETPCTADVAARIGRAAVLLSDGGRVLIARDTRPSGPELEAAVAEGVCGAGGEALFAGVLPTSAVSAGLAAGLADVGVMITASHNPAPDNGFKLFGPGGRKLSDEDNRTVEGWLAEPATVRTAPRREARLEVVGAYTAALEAAVGDLSDLPGPIAVDLAAGAAVSVAGWLRHSLPGVVLIGVEGTINEGVGSTHPAALAEAVRLHGCVGGFAVDGDADRCVMVDEAGEVVPGDGLTWLLARGRRVRGLAVTVMSNAALEGALPGVTVVRTPVGDRHLAAAMVEHDLPLGCEESGHVLFDDALPTGDGLVTGLRALRQAAHLGSSISEALTGFQPFPRALTKVRVASRPALSDVAPLEAARLAGEQRLGHGGRVFLRYSGTEPVLRLLVEGRDPADVAAVAELVTEAAREALS